MEINLTEEYLSLSYFSKLKLKTQAHNILTILQGFVYKIYSKNNFLKSITVGKSKYVIMKLKAMFLKLIHFA